MPDLARFTSPGRATAGAPLALQSVMVRRIVAVCGTVAVGALLGAGCIADVETMASQDAVDVGEARALIMGAMGEKTVASQDAVDVAEALMGEQIGEARQAGTAEGEACRVYCATSYAAACLYVQHVCAGATVVTLGGAAVPCATATAAVCLSSVALGTLCAGRCPP
jgi:hypothetical protein